MTPIIIDKTEDTPSIILDKTSKKFIFEGTSIPENAKDFFEPIIKWIEEYIADPNEETIMHFKMDYFNTASSKKLLDIFESLKALVQNGKMLIINWHILEEDDDMIDAGEQFALLMEYKFNFVKRIDQ